MKKNYTYCLLLAGLLLLVSCGKKVAVSEYNIIPEPVELTMDKGEFTFSKSTSCYSGNLGLNDTTVKYITKTLRQWHFNLSLVGTPESGCLQLLLNETPDPELGEEGYTLTIDKDGIVIAANTRHGIFYGFQTFIQMLPVDINKVRYSKVVLPACHVRDYPRFRWRGTHLDVSRHFFSVNEVKRQLDVMAAYKMNKFHWHLTDDHGWRVQIDKYPLLTDIGAWRVDRADDPWGEGAPATADEARSYGGYYTKEEIAEVVAYAAERYIDVIPEIDFPGHCCAILEAYPQLACAGDDTTYTVQFGPYWPPRAILCGGNDSVVAFLKNVMDEIIPLFPYKYIHIGGDEAVKDNWTRCPRCQERIKSLKLDGEEGLQGWMMQAIEEHVRMQGKSIIGWDEILAGGLSPDATVMSWQGTKGGITAAKHGNKVIMTPTEFCYLNFYQANAAYQPPAMPNSLVTLRKVYQFDPMPAGLSAAAQQLILGGQANLWTEYINTPADLEYMMLPRLLAMSEVLWSPVDHKEWNRFRHKVAQQRRRLEVNDYVVGTSSFQPWMNVEKQNDGTYKVALDFEVEGTHLYYRLGEEGVYQLYSQPFEAPKGAQITTVSFYQGRVCEQPYHFVVNGD